LLFRQTGKESERLETIYTLKNTRVQYDDFQTSATAVFDDEQLNTHLLTLKSLISRYDRQIAESLNTDAQAREILSANQSSEDSLGIYMFDVQDVTTANVDFGRQKADLEEVQNQLFVIDNHLNILFDKQINAISNKPFISNYILFSILCIALIIILASVILIRLNGSIGSLSVVLKNIAKGELPDDEATGRDEFYPIVEARNELVHYIDSANQFARHIGDGDFDFEFSPKSHQDALGNSLIEMRNRLQQVAREDKIRNWVNEGQAKFGEILRQHSDDLDSLGTALINNLVEYLGGSQGALFILKEDDDDAHLELLAAYAFQRKKFIEKRIEIGEGLAGQAFMEGKTIYLKQIKTDHYNITTGLGESRPSSLLIVPLKQEDKIEGVIEIASLNELKPHEIEFIEKIGESIASSLNTGKINETTRLLLNETQEKAEQMKAQEEELRQNMEELAATQEQMERRNKELEEIQNKFDEERYLLNALLSSSNDRIYFKDLDSKFVRVSKSMIDLFHKKDESEIIGKSDFDFGFEEHARVAFEDEQRIIRTGSALEDMIEKEKWDDGRVTWVSTTKNPLKNLEGKTVGTFGISRDVTKSKLTEVEMHKRKDWFDHFFKFHTTGFVVLDQNGRVGFASMGILEKAGMTYFEGLAFEDIFEQKTFAEFLSDIDFSNTRDKKFELELKLRGTAEGTIKVAVIAGSKVNEDETSNIFIIYD
jgi:PAS domain S-box-containing protein